MAAVQREDGVEAKSKKNYSKTVQQENSARSLEREVMVESVSSSTTEHSLWRTLERQHSPWKMLETKAVSEKLSKEEKRRHSRTSYSEESEPRSQSSRKHSSSSGGGEKSVRRGHHGFDSSSKRNMAPQHSTSTKKPSERETKRTEPEVSSSSLVLTPLRCANPPPRISTQAGSNETRPSSLSYKERERSSSSLNTFKRRDSSNTKSYKDYLKDKDKAARKEKKDRHGSTHRYGGSEESISNAKMVEMQVRKIRNSLEKLSREDLKTKKASTSKSVHSKLRYKQDEGPRNTREEEDTQLTPFLPSSRCCSPPPRPTVVTKYWSDADETEDESDNEKHFMHVSSVNIVLNYLKAHPDKYYRKGKEAGSQVTGSRNVHPKRGIIKRLTLPSPLDSQVRGPKGNRAREQRDSDRGRGMHSRYPASQQHGSPHKEDHDLPVRGQYDHCSRSHSPLNELSGVIGLIASLTDQQSRSPPRHSERYERDRSLSPMPDHRRHCYRSRSPLDSQSTQVQQHRSPPSPLGHRDSRSRQLQSAYRDEELHSPWHKRRSLTRESYSPLRHRSDHLRNRGSQSPSRDIKSSLGYRESRSPSSYRDNSLRDKEACSPSRFRDDRVNRRGSYSPSRFRYNHVNSRESYSPSRFRDDCVNSRRSYSPSRFRDDRVNSRGSYSPSRYRDDHVNNRGSHSPCRYRDDLMRSRLSHSVSRYRADHENSRGSHSPSSYRDNCMRSRLSHSPSMYRDDHVNSKSHSPSRYRDDHVRSRLSCSASTYRDNSLRNRESHSPSSYSNDCIGDIQSQSPSMHRDGSVKYRDDLLGGRVSDSHEKDLSPKLHKGRYDEGSRPSHEFSKRPLTADNSIRPRLERAQSFASSIRKEQGKESCENSDFFFNPAVENSDEDYQEISGPYTEEDSIQKEEEYSTEDKSFSIKSRRDINTSAAVASKDVVAHKGLSDAMHCDHVIKPRICDTITQGECTPKRKTEVITLCDEPIIEQPEDYLKDYSTLSTSHRPSFVPDVHESQVPTGFTESSEPLVIPDSAPGPSGILSAASNGKKDVEEPLYYLSDSDHDPDLEHLDSCLSEVSSLIAHHEAVTSDKTPPNTGSVVAVPVEQEGVTMENTRQDKENASLTLNSAEMSTLLNLIEIAKEHTATGHDLSANLPMILERIRQNTTTSRNVSGSSEAQNRGDERQRPNMLHVSGGMQDSTMETESSIDTISGSNIKNEKGRNNSQKSDQGVASAFNKDRKILPKGIVSQSNIIMKLSESTASSKSQHSVSEAKVETAKDKSLGENLLDTKGKNNSKSKQSSKKHPEEKANDKFSGDEKLSGDKDDGKSKQKKGSLSVVKVSDKSSGREKLSNTKSNSKSQQGRSKPLEKKANDKPTGGKKSSETKEIKKLQPDKSKLEVGKAIDKPAGSVKLPEVKDNREPKHSISKMQVDRSNDKPSGGETMREAQQKSTKQKASNIPPSGKDKSKKQSLKNKGEVKGTLFKNNPGYKGHKEKELKGDRNSSLQKCFADMQRVTIYVEDLKASKKSVTQSKSGKPCQIKRSTLLASSEKTPFKQVGERFFVKDHSDCSSDLESSEAKKGTDTLSASASSPQKVHPLHQETIVVDHFLNLCHACKHKLIPDAYTSISLSTGTVTMRCGNCHTFTRMEKVMPLDNYVKTSNTQKAALQKKSHPIKTPSVSKTPVKGKNDISKETNVTDDGQNEIQRETERPPDTNKEIRIEKKSSQGIQTAEKDKTAPQISTKLIGKLPKSVYHEVATQSTSISKTSQGSEGTTCKKQRKENKTSISTNRDKDSQLNEDTEASPNSFDTIDPSLLVFPWGSSRKRKKIHEKLNVNHDSSNSDEEHTIKQQQKRPTKRKRIINNPSSSEESNGDIAAPP